MKLVGYADKLSVEAGGDVSFMVSSDFPSFDAEVVRLIHGDIRSPGPGFKSEPVSGAVNGTYPGKVQHIRPGSYAVVADDASMMLQGDFTLQMWFLATTPTKGTQTLLAKHSTKGETVLLQIEDGRIKFAVGNNRVHAQIPVLTNEWYYLAASLSARQKQIRLVVEQVSGVVLAAPTDSTADYSQSIGEADGTLLLAAQYVDGSSNEVCHFFNGKIDSPRIYDRVLTDAEIAGAKSGEHPSDPIAAWDFSLDIQTSRVTDISGNGNDGVVVNKPTRGVTGRNWDGTVMAWPQAPHQYCAIHFHDDDLSDAGWDTSCTWRIPVDLRSGLYALRVWNGDDEDYIPFVIAQSLGEARSNILLVLPIFSYLAYGNEQMPNGGTLAGFVEGYPRCPEDAYIVDNHLLSLYDKHADGSSVCYASWLRPLVNMRPKYVQHYLDDGKGSPHQLPADLHLIDWLEARGHAVDVISDLELHRDGLTRLAPYRVVLTGTHAEYTSGAMIDAYQGYLHSGGRLMQMGANSMFWVTEVDRDTGDGVEIRRRSAPAWSWPAAPGEAHLSNTGELGGYWSNRGRSAHKWLGVDTNSEGYTHGRPYHRTAESRDPRVGFIFAGIAEDEPIGAIPSLVNGWGAAGFELDWSDPALRPSHTLVVATAEDFSEDFEVISAVMAGGPEQHPKVRSDVVFLEYPAGGAVFSVSSIAWCGCLSHNGYDNNVSRLTGNVLDGFLAEGIPPWQTTS